MISIKLKSIIFIFFVKLTLTESSICGNWTEYEGEKCLKIINNQSLVNYETAVQICEKTEFSTLLTIHSLKEQNFIENLIFNESDIVDNVWIGLRNIHNWTDYTPVKYTNWADKNPFNIKDHNCVQILSEDILKGKWSTESCHRAGVVVCQKSLNNIELRKTLLKTQNELLEAQKLIASKNCYNHKVLDVSQFHNINLTLTNTFIDDNGKNKSLIIVGNRDWGHFDDAVKLCNKVNASLVEIRSSNKQKSIEKLLTESGFNSSFWLNAKRDTSGVFRWVSDGQAITYTNWQTEHPLPDLKNVYIHAFGGYHYKWLSGLINYLGFAICELQLY